MYLLRSILLLLPLLTALHAFGQQEYADSLEKRLKKVTGTERITTLNELTFFYFQKDVKKSTAFGREALRLARRQNDKRLLASTLNDYSMPFLTDGDFQRAIDLNLESLKLRKELGDSAGMMSNYAKLGNAYLELTQFDKATDAYTKALELSRHMKLQAQEIQILINLGNVLELSGMLKEAYKMQKAAVHLADQSEDLQSQISSRSNLASICEKLKRYDESIRYYKATIPLIEKSDQPELMASVYQGLGVVARSQKDNRKGLEYYKKAFAIYQKLNSRLGLGVISINIANVYSEIGMADSAEAYLQTGLRNSLFTKSYKQIKHAYEGLAQLEKSRGNYKKAFDYMMLVSDYKDSVQFFQGNNAISEMYAKYETAEKERQLAQSRLNNAEKDKTIAQTELKATKEKEKRLIWSAVAALLILGSIIFIRYLARKRKAALLEVEATKKTEQLRRERELNEQKISISRELHDNIGSQLTYMISSMDNLTYKVRENDAVAGTITELSNFGRGTMQELRSTIWAINTEDGSVELLFRKLEELRPKIPIALSLKNDLKENVPLKAVEMLNLYRIAQEALQNCLKYADATEFSLHCATGADGGIVLTFTDNGKGFDTIRAGIGNGLRNMRHRCEQIGGTFGIVSSEGTGTRLECALRHLSY